MEELASKGKKFSSNPFAAFSDPTVQEKFEEGAGIDEMISTEGKAERAKKKKKKKHKGKESSSASACLPDETPPRSTKKGLGNMPIPHLHSESLNTNQKESQNTDAERPSGSGLHSVRTHSSEMADAIMKQPTKQVTCKKKPANQGARFSKPDVCVSEETKPFEEGNSSLSNLERFTQETTLLSKDKREEKNLYQVLKLICKVGLTALRNLFMDIHPKWSNKPGDAKNLEKGVMNLKGHERALFNDGDINKWDVSLITTVLLYSKKCKDEIAKRPGFEDAIRSIKDNKNKLLSHLSDDKMSDTDFHSHWPAISRHVETIGASKEDIDSILEENTLEKGKSYRDLFLEEIASRSGAEQTMVEEIRKVQRQQQLTNDMLGTMVANKTSDDSESRNQLGPHQGGPNWDEWTKFRNNVCSFDYSQNNYLLITDAMPPELMESFSIFRIVRWKLVLDFDPSSEEKGMYQNFVSKDDKSSLISMITPGEVRSLSITKLAGHIDAKKNQWMFVNGRDGDGSDGGPQELENWEDKSVKEISKFFGCLSEPDKFDKNMPLICLVLPFREETVPFIEVTLQRLVENFNEFKLKFVASTPKDHFCALPDKLLKKININTTDLDPQLLCRGMENLFHISSELFYSIPTSLSDMPAKLNQTEYLYLKEYLDVLYEGCEKLSSIIDDESDDQALEDLIEEDRRSFMSGNCISFVSLKYNHDAKREISNKIQVHIQRLLDQGSTHPVIVEISHSPGSGGSTIARRVMWDLHKSYPCAFAKLEDHRYDLEDDSLFLDSLADRISTMQEICSTTPVVLLDGKHTRIEALSSRLVRILNSKGKKAVLLRCNHISADRNGHFSESSDVHATFSVNVKLEQSKADLKEFEAKYKDYIEGFKSGLSRVFHFPLLAMLEEFGEKLQQIVFESYDGMKDLEKEIVLVVAFIQKYAAQATPAPLLYAAFKKTLNPTSSSHQYDQAITYEDISKIMTEPLSNLMVLAKPTEFIYRGRFKRTNQFQERYTLQHPNVAELVLKKAKKALKLNTMGIVREFLEFAIYEDLRFIHLMKDLFVLNGSGQGRFSLLFEELKAVDPEEAGEIFCSAAEKTKDIAVVTSAARFFAKLQSPSFSKAKELIERAFEFRNAKEKQKTIYDVKGVVLSKELEFLSKHGKIKSLEELEPLAQEVLDAFRRAKTRPPSFPNPLIGEVRTWLTCMDWITKNCFHGDSTKALQFVTSREAPAFFQNCISNSFTLLNTVDDMVQTVSSLSDPDKTQREANNVRLALMKTIKSLLVDRRSAEGKIDVIEACEALRSAAEFQTSSQLEIKRLQVQYAFSSVKQMENVSEEGLEYLTELLTELVEETKDAVFAKHLMKICVLTSSYSLEKGLDVCAVWRRNSNYDPFPYFYEMMIHFVNMLDGSVFEFRAKYHEALDNCHNRSHHNCRRTMSTHFLGKTGTGMCRLITRNTLFPRGEKKDEVPETYWKTKSRKKLLECSGRIRTRPTSNGTRPRVYIELLQGNIMLHVARGANIGEADRHFVPGTKVYFVVSFNLLGPVANGITFEPSEPICETAEP